MGGWVLGGGECWRIGGESKKKKGKKIARIQKGIRAPLSRGGGFLSDFGLKWAGEIRGQHFTLAVKSLFGGMSSALSLFFRGGGCDSSPPQPVLKAGWPQPLSVGDLLTFLCSLKFWVWST